MTHVTHVVATSPCGSQSAGFNYSLRLIRSLLCHAYRATVFVVAATLPTLSYAEYVVPAGFDNLPSVTISPATSGSDQSRFLSAMNGFGSSGGIIYMDPGLYRLSGITLKSNIHVRMRPGVVIEQNGSRNVFEIDGTASEDAANVSIAGTSSEMKPVIKAEVPTGGADEGAFRAVKVARAFNFMIGNLKIEDQNTRFSTIITNDDTNQGTIENITMTGSGPGWGLYQAQGGQNVTARNLDGEGGFTLRLEQGGNGATGIQNLNAHNIISRNGRGAVLIAPKSQQNGVATVTKVRSYGSTWAVQASDGKDGGVFERITITDIEATYESDGAQFKRWGSGQVIADFLPESEKQGIEFYDLPSNPTKFQIGPSFGVAKVSSVPWVEIYDVKDPVDFPAAFEDQPKLVDAFSDQIIRQQRQANPAVPVLPGDFDGDGAVNGSDFLELQRSFGSEAGALHNDFLGSEVGSNQLETWSTTYGAQVRSTSTLASAVVPEPTTGALLLTCAVLAQRRRFWRR